MNRKLQHVIVATSTCIVALLMFGAVTVRSASPDDPYTQLGVYSDVLSKIQVEYVEEPDLDEVTLGAINGMLEAIDPFASYLNSEQYQQYQEQYSEGAPGVGLLLARGPGYLRVVNALPGSPADEAGLATGDVVESINEISTRDMPLAAAQLLLQGEPGTTVTITALTPQTEEPIDFTITRANLVFPAVSSRLVRDEVDEPVGVIGTVTLAEGRVAEIAAAIERLEGQGATRLILDLRNNAYGPVEEGIALADLFMDEGMIAYSEGQTTSRRNYTAAASRSVTDLPVAVLTNRATAGAAEVAAAALLDSGRATVVGEPTFGNAAIRGAVPLDDGGAIILATAKYYSPKGNAIQDERVTPPYLQVQNSRPEPLLAPDGEALSPPETLIEESGEEPDDLILDRTWELIREGTILVGE